jgi:Trypsin-co-occurring domain 2
MAEPIGELAAAIESLRAELTEAMAAGAGQPMRFSLEPIELTLQVTVTKGLDGKIGWNVVGFGGKRESASTDTLTVRLKPLWTLANGSVTPDFAIAAEAPAGAHFGPRPPSLQEHAHDGDGAD